MNIRSVSYCKAVHSLCFHDQGGDVVGALRDVQHPLQAQALIYGWLSFEIPDAMDLNSILKVCAPLIASGEAVIAMQAQSTGAKQPILDGVYKLHNN